MSRPIPTHATLDDWIAREAIAFSVDSPETLHAAVDKMIASLDDSVELLGFGEALHGGEEILLLRNRLFQRLVEVHGFSAIAIESSFPRSRVVNEYIAGRGPASFEAVRDTGFGQAFGVLEANRELVEWMWHYNAAPSHRVKLQFYGFDIPTGTIGIASPRQVLHFVLDYLASSDSNRSQKRRERIEQLLGQDSDWENPAAVADPTKSVGVSPAATALRIETEELISELRARRPELIANSDEARYTEALHYASVARQLLNFHAAMARETEYSERLGIRDALMADNLVYVVSRERGRGKVLAFAHNSHLKRGRAHWQMGADLHTWWPAGSHLDTMLGLRYAVIGSAVGVSEANGIGQPEEGTLEERLTSVPGPALFLPTHKGRGVPLAAIADLPIRSGSIKNPTYFPLTAQSITDFDWLAVLDSTAYNRGGPPLQEWDANPEQ
jgi:erythromycin esterase